jgi:hypothetical protein
MAPTLSQKLLRFFQRPFMSIVEHPALLIDPSGTEILLLGPIVYELLKDPALKYVRVFDIERWKQDTGYKHEYILCGISIISDTQKNAEIRCLRFERGRGRSLDDGGTVPTWFPGSGSPSLYVVKESDFAPNSTPLPTPSPSPLFSLPKLTRARTAPAQLLNTNTDTAELTAKLSTKPLQRVEGQRLPPYPTTVSHAIDSITIMRKKITRESDTLIETVQLNIPLHDLLLFIQLCSEENESYTPFSRNCYWFANVIIRFAKTLDGATYIAGPNVLQAGKFGGVGGSAIYTLSADEVGWNYLASRYPSKLEASIQREEEKRRVLGNESDILKRMKMDEQRVSLSYPSK